MTDEPGLNGEDGAAGSGRWDGWLGPRIWGPALGILLGAVAVAVVLFATKDTTTVKTTVEMVCKAGEPGCVLRQKVHWHADFAVFIRGQRFDFNGSYISHAPDRELSDNVHIHDPRHTVVHVHREQTTWDEFFKSLGWELSDTCLKTRDKQYCTGNGETLTFWANGVKIDSLMFENIGDLDRVMINFGSEPDAQLLARFNDTDKGVTDQACIPSELCKSRIPPGEPKEECTVSSTECN
jgi:hypothetical protein